MLMGNNAAGLAVFKDHTGTERVLGLRQPSPLHKKMRAARQSFTGYLASQGLGLIPRDQWKPIDRRDVLGTQFINNQKSCGGCVGWSAAQANMRMRALRGMTFEKLSGAYVYAHINGGYDGGAVITDAMNALEQHGTCLEDAMDYPEIFLRQVPSGADAQAQRFKLRLGLTLSTFDEIGTALQMGLIPQFPINVGGNFENFDSDGVAGASSGGNHSVHADGMKLSSHGKWILDMPNSWGVNWGPTGNGRCFLSEDAIQWASSNSDAYVHVDELQDPSDPLNPPAPTA